MSKVYYIHTHNTIIDLASDIVVVEYLFKKTFFDGPSRQQRKFGVARATKVTRFFHHRGAANPLANFFRVTVHPRRTRVGRNTDRVDTMVGMSGGMLRYATFFSLLLSCRCCSTNRGRKERRQDGKGGRRGYCVVSDDQQGSLA